MTEEEIDEVLKDSDSWKAAGSYQRESFSQRMSSRQYGWDALTQAWGWYACGYADGGEE